MKKIVIAFTLALAAIMVLGSTALAWDYEDPCVADNEDFIGGALEHPSFSKVGEEGGNVRPGVALFEIAHLLKFSYHRPPTLWQPPRFYPGP
ncbi:unnamed protein product [marine sediment metagenome]|uniref:Uncharacterized protein n=1 Tax=marine sediment metagenome TaxID=412755 RepID=X1VGN5_9ZZZZ